MDLYERIEFNNKVDKMIENLKKIIKNRNDEDLNRVKKKIMVEINMESDLLLKQLYLEMRKNLFKSSPFDNNLKNQNLFDDLGLRAKILNECKFKLNNNLSHYKIFNNTDTISKNLNKISMTGSAVGVIWAVVGGTILPLSLVIASVLIYKIGKNKTERERQESIDRFFENLKRDFKIWLNDVEKFLIKEIKKTFPDFS